MIRGMLHRLPLAVTEARHIWRMTRRAGLHWQVIAAVDTFMCIARFPQTEREVPPLPLRRVEP